MSSSEKVLGSAVLFLCVCVCPEHISGSQDQCRWIVLQAVILSPASASSVGSTLPLLSEPQFQVEASF